MIIFLDFDGVISSNRAFMAQQHIEDFWLRWLDPVACSMVRLLCEQFDAKIVVTSTWRNRGFEDVVEICLAAHGLDKHVHEDWRTKDLWKSGSSSLSRSLEVSDWLERNCPWIYGEEAPFIILDDDGFEWTEAQKQFWVQPDSLDGLSTINFEKAVKMCEYLTGRKFSMNGVSEL